MKILEMPLKGISDIQSAVNIISLINPAFIVLVNGNSNEKIEMIGQLNKKFSSIGKSSKIISPEIGTGVDV